MLLILILHLLQTAHAEKPIFWVHQNSIGAAVCEELLETKSLGIYAEPVIHEQLLKSKFLEHITEAGELEVMSDYFLSHGDPYVSHFGTYLQLVSQADPDDPTQRTQIDRARALASHYFARWFFSPTDLIIPNSFGISRSGIPAVLEFASASSLRRFFRYGGKAWFNRWKIKKLVLRSDLTTPLEDIYTLEDVELLKSLPSLEEIDYEPHYLQFPLHLAAGNPVTQALSSLPSLKAFFLEGIQISPLPRVIEFVIPLPTKP